MDVQTIQKINDLALKLQQQAGMSREEAVKQAEIMLSKGEKLEINEISPQKLQEMETKPENTNVSWQEAMKKNTDFIVRNFKDIQREIVSLKAEIDNLKNQIRNMHLSAPKPEPKKESQQQLKEEKPKEHPRQGQYTEKDVSIEKMFYFGNKK